MTFLDVKIIAWAFTVGRLSGPQSLGPVLAAVSEPADTEVSAGMDEVTPELEL
jgi:hypothetical protein